MSLRLEIHELAETPPDAIEAGLVLVDSPDGGPPGPGEVKVEVRTVQVGWVDLLMTSGQYQHVPVLPYSPGIEYAGVIAAIGPDVTQFKVGDRVMSDGTLTGPRSKGAYQREGGFAQVALAPVDGVHAIPGDLSFDEAANLLGNYETAYHALVTTAKLQAGETVLILGATGSTGLAAVHIAKLLGATVIAVGRSAEKLALVAAEGADHTVVSRVLDGAPAFREEVKALTGGRGVDVVYDGVGGAVSSEALRCVDFGARFVIVGWASTPFVAKGKGGRGAPNVNVLPTNLILMKGVAVLGSPMVIATHRDPTLRPQRLAQVLEWAERGQIRPKVAASYPLLDYKTAMRAKWEGQAVGGIVLHPYGDVLQGRARV